ncbi:branched-chain amino acid ABC transporter substrate-binding protein [Herbaspirillum rhizosphaerae]|uniref:branched-chain amino acid ABC transporter substrate-binding protein n=1 Tax=Herbaspirillum rhizosphaerae TaxID=346179 RepID=UPI00067DF340|nr:branched-chain amino acid ABC transporter substrate-binding protein [Herbaspirillum rhizosphaerae]
MLIIRNISAWLLLLVASAAATASAAPASLVVRLGFSGPLSGPQASVGKDALNGAQLAIDRLNQQGSSIDGKVLRFELLAKDDEADPGIGAIRAKELVDAGVRAVLGPFNSGVTLAAAPIYNEAGIVSLTVASNPKATLSPSNRQASQVFRIAASDTDMGSKMALYAARNLKLKAVAIIDDGSVYAQGLIEEFQKTGKQNGMQIVLREVVSDRRIDFRGVLGKIREARGDAIFFGGYAPQASAMLKQMQQMGMSIPLLGGDTLCSVTMMMQAGSGVGEGTYCVQGGVWLTRVSDGAVFAAAYQARYGAMPGIFAPTYYDGVLLLERAMKSANAIDPHVFAPVLARMRYKGVTATYEFDARHNMKDSTVTILRLQDGKLAPLSSF